MSVTPWYSAWLRQPSTSQGASSTILYWRNSSPYKSKAPALEVRGREEVNRASWALLPRLLRAGQGPAALGNDLGGHSKHGLGPRDPHRDRGVLACAAVVLVREAPLGEVPPLGVDQAVGAGVNDDLADFVDPANEAAPLESHLPGVEQREQLCREVGAQVAALDGVGRVGHSASFLSVLDGLATSAMQGIVGSDGRTTPSYAELRQATPNYAKLRQGAVAGQLAPGLAARSQHRDSHVGASGVGALVAQAAVLIVPALGVNQAVGVEVGDDQDAAACAKHGLVGGDIHLKNVDVAVRVRVLQVDRLGVEQRKQLRGLVVAKVAGLDGARLNAAGPLAPVLTLGLTRLLALLTTRKLHGRHCDYLLSVEICLTIRAQKCPGNAIFTSLLRC